MHLIIKGNFCFGVNGRFGTRCIVTLYLFSKRTLKRTIAAFLRTIELTTLGSSALPSLSLSKYCRGTIQ